jgi:hypothetical protein
MGFAGAGLGVYLGVLFVLNEFKNKILCSSPYICYAIKKYLAI